MIEVKKKNNNAWRIIYNNESYKQIRKELKNENSSIGEGGFNTCPDG